MRSPSYVVFALAFENGHFHRYLSSPSDGYSSKRSRCTLSYQSRCIELVQFLVPSTSDTCLGWKPSTQLVLLFFSTPYGWVRFPFVVHRVDGGQLGGGEEEQVQWYQARGGLVSGGVAGSGASRVHVRHVVDRAGDNLGRGGARWHVRGGCGV